MPFVAPNNESLLDSLTPEGKKRYAWLRQGAQDVLTSHPEKSSEVLTQYLHDVLQNEATYAAPKVGNFNTDNRERVQRKNQNPYDVSAASTTLDPRDLEVQLNKARGNFDYDFYKNNVEHADLGTQETWKTYVRHMEGPSLIGGAVKQFYNTDKGGMQWGGLVGALLGGVAGYKLIASFGTGWFGLAAGAIATLMGAWLGNQATDMIGGMMQRSKDAPKAPETPARAPSKAPEKTEQPAATLSPEAMEKAKAAAVATSAAEHVDRENIGGFSHNAPKASPEKIAKNQSPPPAMP